MIAAAKTYAQAAVSKATSLAADVRAKATDVYEQVAEQVTAKIRNPVAERVEAAMAKAQEVKSVVTSWATASHEAIKDEGLKAWAFETLRAARGTAGGALTTAQDAALEKAKEARASALESVAMAQVKATEMAELAKARTSEVAAQAQAKGQEVAQSAREAAADKNIQAGAAAAAGGAVALGTTGGAAGLATGTVAGAAIGLVPAVFTFGLSIPIGAVIGGATGLVSGVAAGSAVGAVGGGAAGYGVKKNSAEISGMAAQTMNKVSDSAEYVKGHASASVDFVREKASVVRARLVGGGTGGTEDKN